MPVRVATFPIGSAVAAGAGEAGAGAAAGVGVVAGAGVTAGAGFGVGCACANLVEPDIATTAGAPPPSTAIAKTFAGPASMKQPRSQVTNKSRGVGTGSPERE